MPSPTQLHAPSFSGKEKHKNNFPNWTEDIEIGVTTVIHSGHKDEGQESQLKEASSNI